MRALFAKLTTAHSTEESQAEQERLVRVVLTMITLCMIPITIIIAFFLAAGIFQQIALIQVLGVDILAATGWLLVSRRRIQITEGLIIACFFLLAAYGSYSKGLVTANVLIYPIVILITALFKSGRWSLQVLVGSILAYSLLGAFHDQKPFNQMVVAIIVFSICLISLALVQWYATRLLKEALAKARSVASNLRSEIAEREEMQTKLQYLNAHDALTGLFNRFFLEAEQERLQNSRLFPVTAVMIDVDGLKRINDHYGHAAGDELLKRTAKLLKDSFRAEDVVARIGGDEFAILLPETDAATMQLILPRLKRNLEKYNQEYFDLPIELSIGTETGEKGSILTATMKKADDRMYEDKWGKKVDAWGSVEIK